MNILSRAIIMDESLILDVFLWDGNMWYHIADRFNITQLQWCLHDYLDQYTKICLHNRKACCIFPHSIYKQDRLFPVLPWPQECIVASVQMGFLTPGRFGVKAQSLTTAIYKWTNRCWGWRKNAERTRTVRNQNSTVPCPYWVHERAVT